MKVSYVVPVFRNEGTIAKTFEAIAQLFRDVLTEYEFEVIFVNDGSDDGSMEEMRRVRAGTDRVKLLSLTRNFGQLAAIVAGYNEADGDAVINISADLQDPVELSADMIRHWRGGSDIVVAYREQREDAALARLFSRLAYAALRSSNKKIPAGGFDYVLMSRKALTSFLSYRGRNRFFQGDVLWAGHSTTFLPYTRRRREVGRSQYNFAKKLKLFFDFLLDGTYLPIRLMSLTGFFTALAGLGYALVVVGAWALGATPFVGWAPLMILILVIGGIIMLMLGMIGEYLWRILDEIKAKPLYMIDKKE